VRKGSGVFRILVRRRRRRRGRGVWWRELGPSLETNIIFVIKMIKFGCILTQFLTGRKHGQSL